MKSLKIEPKPPSHLKLLRLTKGLTLEQVAKILGIHFTTVALFEKGLPHSDLYLRMAELFEVDVKTLLEQNRSKETRKKRRTIKKRK
jgi:transcriptional regulator with XRE-family HTH domain